MSGGEKWWRNLLPLLCVGALGAMVWWIAIAPAVACGRADACEPATSGWRSMPGLLTVLLSAAPLIVLLASEAGLWRSQRLIDNMPEPVRQGSDERETGWQVAQRSMLFWIAIVLVTAVMFLSWNFVFNAPLGRGTYVDPLVPFLRGLHMPGGADANTWRFASRTLTINGIGFTVAYVVVLYRMFVRLNTAAMSAIDTLSDAMHLMAAIMVSTVGRMVLATSFPDDTGDSYAVAFAVVAGVRPTLALDWLWSLAWRGLGKVLSSAPTQRPAPADGAIPIEVPIELLDGFGDRRREVLARLEGLDIATCQRLAFHNPLLIWLRTPYLLPEVLDWCGQAMLAVLLPTRLADLRACGARTIFDVLTWLDAGYEPVLKALGVQAAEAPALATGLRRCAQVRDLEALAAAL